MSPKQFCYWLRGFLEMANPKMMDESQMKMLKNHLDLVFCDVTSESELSIDASVSKESLQILTDSLTNQDKVRKTLADAVNGNSITNDMKCSSSKCSKGTNLC